MKMNFQIKMTKEEIIDEIIEIEVDQMCGSSLRECAMETLRRDYAGFDEKNLVKILKGLR